MAHAIPRLMGALSLACISAAAFSDAMAEPASLGPEAVEHRPVTDAPDQADSRVRPLARRAFRMARPARVDMRCRKPCRLDRRRTLG